MREVKFRVFVKEATGRYRQGMHDDWDFLINGNFEMEFGHSKTLLMLALNPEYSDRFELMQYTGLKDKKGIEVFEGDIINGWYTKLGYYPVEFIDGCFRVVGTPRGEVALSYMLKEGSVVQGNIHQHPELLNKE